MPAIAALPTVRMSASYHNSQNNAAGLTVTPIKIRQQVEQCQDWQKSNINFEEDPSGFFVGEVPDHDSRLNELEMVWAVAVDATFAIVFVTDESRLPRRSIF